MLVSFIIPAHNECAGIEATIRSIRQAANQAQLRHEIVVADDSSDDGTGDVALEVGATVVRIEARHISAARNAGAAASHGEALIFVDADTVVNAEVVRAAVNALQSGAVGGGARVRFDEPVPLWCRLLMPIVMWSYQRAKFAAGCFVFCSRSAFHAAGGFDEQVFAGEEVELSRALAKLGTMAMLREHVTTSGRKLRTHSVWAMLALLVRYAVKGRRMVEQREGLELWYGPRRDDARAGRKGA
ncbi:MAG: glycosyltransferase [Phycisphaerae bacterium]|nr:glycosyltransferase [Phycisphaerae bacterium]